MKLDYKDRGEYIYTIYIFGQPEFILIENESIIDVNIKDKKSNDDYSTLEIIYSDVFFDYNMRNIKKDNFLVIIVVCNSVGQFLRQLDINVESIKFGNHPYIDCINFSFEQITINKGYHSIPSTFQQASDVYKSERISYIRNSIINKILS